MASEKGKAAFAYMMAKMKADAQATYKEVAAASKKAGHAVYPIMWGRAQALLGRVKMKPRGQGKFAMAKAAKASGGVSSGGMPTGPKRRGRPPGSKNKSTLARMAAAEGRGRPSFGNGSASITVASGELDNAQSFVDALNGGRRAALRYHAGAWVLTAD